MLNSALDCRQQGLQQISQLRLRACSGLDHFLVVDGLIEDAGSHVGDAGDAEDFDAHVPGDDHLVNGGHADQVRAPGAEGSDCRGRFVAGPGYAQIDSFRDLGGGLGQEAQPLRISLCHVEEPWPEPFVVRPGDGIASGEVNVIGDQNQLTLLEIQPDAAGSVGDDQGRDSQSPEDADGKGDFLRRVSLISVDAALHDRDGCPGDGTYYQTAAMTFYRRPRKVRNLLVGNADWLLHLIRKGT